MQRAYYCVTRVLISIQQLDCIKNKRKILFFFLYFVLKPGMVTWSEGHYQIKHVEKRSFNVN